ncbi:hypothetical protein ACHAQH_005387 [Verticillium albo-atrum]
MKAQFIFTALIATVAAIPTGPGEPAHERRQLGAIFGAIANSCKTEFPPGRGDMDGFQKCLKDRLGPLANQFKPKSN